jgi:iron complex outermembrane recepter protein
LNYAYVGPTYTTLFYSPVTDRLASRGLLSALLTLRTDTWTIEGFGTNLTDKVYVTGSGSNAAFYGPPRQYGVRVSRDF